MSCTTAYTSPGSIFKGEIFVHSSATAADLIAWVEAYLLQRIITAAIVPRAAYRTLRRL